MSEVMSLNILLNCNQGEVASLLEKRVPAGRSKLCLLEA
jgi:hypothetical protein